VEALIDEFGGQLDEPWVAADQDAALVGPAGDEIQQRVD
jgi:hypothetical protein